MVTRDEIRTAYQLVLQREPENEAAYQYHLTFTDAFALGRHLVSSDEFQNILPHKMTPEHHIYSGYHPAELTLFRAFPRYQGPGRAGFVTNFLGVQTRCVLQQPLLPFDGAVEGYPEPVGSTQGETAEWLGTLKAVQEAGSTFRLLELGAGYGPWMAITHKAAELRGVKDVHVYGVEGDAHHVEFMRTNMVDNGIEPEQNTIIHGAIGTEDGVAYWAVEDEPGSVYGGRPVNADGSNYLGDKRQNVVEVPVIGINGLLQRESLWDLLHIDIQGGEGEVCRAGIEEMTRRVRRVVIGTHSRIQDGIVMEAFHKAGWTLENEKPTITIWNDIIPTVEGMTLVDGVQVWRNSKV